jgi:hypothetical protein
MVAIAALAIATVASAGSSGAAYKLDLKGKCHDSSGKFAAASRCTPKPVCKTGKLCGNTCIKTSDICHKP